MYATFLRAFVADPGRIPEEPGAARASGEVEYEDLIEQFGGTSFSHGLYRVARFSDVETWNARVSAAFPEFRESISCFGFDWLGRAFATDKNRSEGGRRGVLMFEPGTGEALEIPANVRTFHDAGLMEFGEAALAIQFHKRWLASGGVWPPYGKCIGYRRPLFLGGKDDIENLELSDIDVYWHLMGQLIQQAKGLPPGSPVRFSHT